MRRAARPAAALAAVLLLAGCGAGAQAGEPTWVPKPSFAGEGEQPSASAILPQPNDPGSSPPPSGSPAPSTGSSAPGKADDPSVVATNLDAPDAIAILPDNTALVGERTTGRIVRVQPFPHQPVVPVRTISGLDTTGGGGLLDLALSPNYLQDGLIFAYLTTPTDDRVVDFTLTGPVTPVLTGIPRGATDNSGQIAFGDDGQLYIGTSDAGQPALAADPNSLAGKVLRVTDIGRPSPGNPNAASPVFTTGHHLVAGLCLIPKTNVLLEVEPPRGVGQGALNVLSGGGDYGWPHPSAASAPALAALPAGTGTPGGCAVLNGNVFVTSLDGAELLETRPTAQGATLSAGPFSVTLQHTYGRLLTVVAAPDGALWLTTSNRDGHGKPIATDERVLRIIPVDNSASTYPG